MSIKQDCPGCGSTAKSGARSVVTYLPDANSAQMEMDWTDGLDPVEAFVCTECGYVIGLVSVRDPGELEADKTDGYRVDEELR